METLVALVQFKFKGYSKVIAGVVEKSLDSRLITGAELVVTRRQAFVQFVQTGFVKIVVQKHLYLQWASDRTD